MNRQLKRWAILTIFVTIAVAAVFLPAGRTVEAQAVCFEETGFCIHNPAFLQYFQARGGTRTFGLPILQRLWDMVRIAQVGARSRRRYVMRYRRAKSGV